MNKKIILTSILALCIAGPAFADTIPGQIADAEDLLDGKGCNEATLNVTEGTANIEAIWTANNYTISYTCANGNDGANNILLQAGCDCTNNPTDDCCIRSTYAVYGKPFSFSSAGCGEAGYHQTGWSCTRDNVANDIPTVYTPGQQLPAWDIPSDLTCTEIREGNAITLNWYDNAQTTSPASSTQCIYGTTSGQGALALPAQPTAPAGHTFGGWKLVANICERFDTSHTCNMNSQCFWFVNPNTNEGSCVNGNENLNGCGNASDRNSCGSVGYCQYALKTCMTNLNLSISFMNNAEECSVHDGVWDNNTCYTVNGFCMGASTYEACQTKNSSGHGEICTWNGDFCMAMR